MTFPDNDRNQVGGRGNGLDLARVVYRLMTNPRGYAKDDIIDDFGVSERTYRTWRSRLIDEFEGFKDASGDSCVVEVKEGGRTYLRLRPDAARNAIDVDFASHIAAIYFAKKVVAFAAQTGLADAMESVMASFNATIRDRTFLNDVRQLDRMFYVIDDAPKDYRDHADIVRDVILATFRRQRIRVQYDSASKSDMQEMTLEPLTLAMWRGGLYIVAGVVGYEQQRMFAVERLMSVELLFERFDYPSRSAYDPEKYLSGAWGIYRGADDEEIEYELIFANQKWLKRYVADRRWHHTQHTTELPDGRLKMTFVVNSSREVDRWIASFGADVQQVKP